MKIILTIICTTLLTSSLTASTGFIEGVISAINGGTFVITGKNHYGKQQGDEAAEHKIPGKGTPVYILDGRITTKAATLKVGRKCFVFWNRHTQQMVVALSGADEKDVQYPAGPALSEAMTNTTQGTIKSATPAEVVFTTANGDKTVPLKKGKTLFLLDNAFNSKFEDVCVAGKRAVAFCYRGREFPNFVVACSKE